jgi:hypothetical protein
LIQRKADAPVGSNHWIMNRPIPDKAEVALEYPDKYYVGTFERSSHYEAHFDVAGVALALARPGDAETRRSIHMHLHYGLFEDILRDLAASAAALPVEAVPHRDALGEAALLLHHALTAGRRGHAGHHK